ncbi:DUF6897 domain-containing protein [Paenibacillus sp. Soil522]|uniref:DUF6897 domain-containing protein n=1 Tax=Paenibacillus sp. Soil522 TaxID=1736388 RepID=UPI0006FD43EE|nr:DUF2642 domain-containing protein [Paenibacillus sp. Soil522]KRE33237.1 hypothetical protein ASG81_23495 [Paenibacillus sp. Soil522]
MSYWCNYQYPAGQSVASDSDRQRNNRSPRSSGVRDHNFLQSLIGKNVKINRGGPDSLQGKLLAVKSDFLVLSTNEGVVYVASSHVKSITEMGGNKSDGNKTGRRDPVFVDANNFAGVIRSFNQQFVQINWGGPEKVEGFIAQVGNSSILLVSGKEAMQIQNDHIKTIKAASNNKTGGNKNENKDENKNDNKKDNKKDNKSNKSNKSN